MSVYFFFFNDTATTEIYPLSLHDALPICQPEHPCRRRGDDLDPPLARQAPCHDAPVVQQVDAILNARQPVGHLAEVRSEEHTSELQSRQYLVCRLLLEKKKKISKNDH